MAEEEAIKAQKDEELKKSVKSGMGLVVFAVLMTVIAVGASIYIAYEKLTEEKRINDAVATKCVETGKTIEGLSGGEPEGQGGGMPEGQSGSTPEISDSMITPNASDYLYIADWGVRIKKPENYYIWYRVIPDTGSEMGAKLEISASPKDAQTWVNYGGFDDGDQLVLIHRRTEANAYEQMGSAPAPMGELDGYYYYISGRQACSADVSQMGIETCREESRIGGEMVEHFKNLDNWSRF